MSKKIVILNGSPRRQGNTSALIKSFTEGAEAAGNTVQEFFLQKMEIKGCLSCCHGNNLNECPCVQKDDMAEIYPAIKEADVVVMASPLYYWTISAQLKVVIDRLFALEEGEENLLRGHGKAGACLMAAAGSDYNDAGPYFDHLMEHLQWENLGSVLAGGVWQAGDIEGKEDLQKAYDLGKSI